MELSHGVQSISYRRRARRDCEVASLEAQLAGVFAHHALQPCTWRRAPSLISDDAVSLLWFGSYYDDDLKDAAVSGAHGRSAF